MSKFNGVFQENLEPLGLPSFVWIKWSDHKLKAEDIKGRMVLEETIHTDLLVWKTYVIMHDCLRYMLIDPAPQEEELKEFDGVKPGIILQSSEGIRVEWSCRGKFVRIYGETEDKARANWNKWVEEHSK